MSGDDDPANLIWEDDSTSTTNGSVWSFTTTLTTTATQTVGDLITETQETPSNNGGDVFAYSVMGTCPSVPFNPAAFQKFFNPIFPGYTATILAFIVIAYGIKQRRNREENVDALIPPGGNDSEDEDEFLALQNQATTRANGYKPETSRL